jgi:acyl-CoA dehydrogenase
MSKVICSEAIARVTDRSMQILGGRGMTRDTVVEHIFRDTRAFRIYDGPSEVHRWALGAYRVRFVLGHARRHRGAADRSIIAMHNWSPPPR